jgi:hypothetical protein
LKSASNFIAISFFFFSSDSDDEIPQHCVWDYAELSTVIHAAVRQVGFRKQITISYPMTEHTVKVKSSSKLARTARDPCVKLLCIMTCLWVVFLPIYCCIRKVCAPFPFPFSWGFSYPPVRLCREC